MLCAMGFFHVDCQRLYQSIDVYKSIGIYNLQQTDSCFVPDLNKTSIMNTDKNLKILVYGATGSQAQTVPTHLLRAGHQPYVLTRSADKTAHHAQAGTAVVEGDMADADRLRELS